MSKSKKKRLERLSESYVVNFAIKTALPFFCPFIFEISNEHISDIAKWVIFCTVAVLDLFLIVLLDFKKKRDRDEAYKNEMTRKAYANLYELNEKKRDAIVETSYIEGVELEKKKIPYNVFKHIVEICGSFKNLIHEVTGINKEYLSVSFIYNYRYVGSKEEDRSWRWVVGRDQTMIIKLDDFIEQNDTVYHALIYGTNTSIFYNDKAEMAEQGMYHMSARDKRHNKVGSIFGVKLMFSNNAESFVEGILVISSYGKRFVESNESKEINKLKRLVIDDLLPAYQRLLEAELGILYLSHEKKKVV